MYESTIDEVDGFIRLLGKAEYCKVFPFIGYNQYNLNQNIISVFQTIVKYLSDIEKEEKKELKVLKDPFLSINLKRSVNSTLDVFRSLFFGVFRNNLEISLLPQDMLEEFGVNRTFVLRPSSEYTTHSLRDEIISKTMLSSISEFDGYLVGLELDDVYIINYPEKATKTICGYVNLCHEAFHIIDREKNFVDLELSIPKLKEATIDIICCLYYGPIYAYSLAEYFRIEPYSHSSTHPEMGTRLFALITALKYMRGQYKNKKYFEKIEITDEIRHILDTLIDGANKYVTQLWRMYKTQDKEEQKEINDNIGKIAHHYQDKLNRYNTPAFIGRMMAGDKTIPESFLDTSRITTLLGYHIPIAVHPILFSNILLADKIKMEEEISHGNKENPLKMLSLFKNSIRKWWVSKQYLSAVRHLHGASSDKTIQTTLKEMHPGVIE